jgi:cytochrome c oxidase cbb3-type subunit 3
MKFIHYLESISGISIYPLMSLMIFVLFFSGVAWYLITMDKRTIDECKQLPLDIPS